MQLSGRFRQESLHHHGEPKSNRRLLGRTIAQLKADLGSLETRPDRAATRIREAVARASR